MAQHPLTITARNRPGPADNGAPDAPLTRLLKGSEVEALCQISRTTRWEWTRRGILPAVKYGRVVRYREADVLALISGNTAA